MNWYVEVLKKYTVFEGRASRSEFWYFTLVNMIVFLICGILDQVLFSELNALVTPVFTSIYFLAILLPAIGVHIRRLHDTGRTGWWLLLNFIPFIGFIVLFIFYVTDSDPGLNKYGPNPKV